MAKGNRPLEDLSETEVVIGVVVNLLRNVWDCDDDEEAGAAYFQAALELLCGYHKLLNGEPMGLSAETISVLDVMESPAIKH